MTNAGFAGIAGMIPEVLRARHAHAIFLKDRGIILAILATPQRPLRAPAAAAQPARD
jgi:hypothetical protein